MCRVPEYFDSSPKPFFFVPRTHPLVGGRRSACNSRYVNGGEISAREGPGAG